MTIKSWVSGQVQRWVRHLRQTSGFDRIDLSGPIGDDWEPTARYMHVEVSTAEVPAGMTIADFIVLLTTKVEALRVEMVTYAATFLAKQTGRPVEKFTVRTKLTAVQCYELAGAMAMRYNRPIELYPNMTIAGLVNAFLGIKPE
jgi:hypothetical protein